MMNVSPLIRFIGDWAIEPFVGMQLRTWNPINYEDYDRELGKWKNRDRQGYDCIITRIEEGQIYIKRADRGYEEIANIDYIQPPSEEDGDDEDD
jgi:hypothetical protein